MVVSLTALIVHIMASSGMHGVDDARRRVDAWEWFNEHQTEQR